ncbi:Zn-dependent protease [Desulfohalotomaculum tongense]|nr:Zn-dependent protease [Desulforadius tongensis]
MAAKKVGLNVSAPMFIPFLGAFISMKDLPKSVKQEAISAIGGRQREHWQLFAA